MNLTTNRLCVLLLPGVALALKLLRLIDNKMAVILLLAVISLFYFSSPRAQEGTDREPSTSVSDEERDQQLGVFRRSIVIVDDAQRIASERFGNFMGQVDGFFSNAGSDDDAVSNESWARIRLDGVRDDGEDFELDPSLKLRAVLPRTERRFKLLFSTEESDSDEVGDDVSTSSPAARSDNSQNASLALRFIRTAREKSDVNIDVGVRQRSGSIQTFVRLNTKYRTTLATYWSFSAANSYYNYSKSGFQDRLSFDFRRPLYEKDDLYFRTYTEFNWRNRQKGAFISQTTGFYWQFGARKALAMEMLAGYYTSLNDGVTDRFTGHKIRLRWRHNVWRPWFYYEIWPSVAWPSITRYNRTEGILLRAEVIIGKR